MLAVARFLVQNLHTDDHSFYGCQATPDLQYLLTVASWHSDLGGAVSHFMIGRTSSLIELALQP